MRTTEREGRPSPGAVCRGTHVALPGAGRVEGAKPRHGERVFTSHAGFCFQHPLHAGSGGCLPPQPQGPPPPGGGGRSLSRATAVLTQRCSPAPGPPSEPSRLIWKRGRDPKGQAAPACGPAVPRGDAGCCPFRAALCGLFWDTALPPVTEDHVGNPLRGHGGRSTARPQTTQGATVRHRQQAPHRWGALARCQ